jgi:hypothetical protein
VPSPQPLIEFLDGAVYDVFSDGSFVWQANAWDASGTRPAHEPCRGNESNLESSDQETAGIHDDDPIATHAASRRYGSYAL